MHTTQDSIIGYNTIINLTYISLDKFVGVDIVPYTQHEFPVASLATRRVHYILNF